jgi:hypothetical protein
MENPREQFRQYLSNLQEPITMFEAVRIGRQVFELTGEETRETISEVWFTGYGLKCSSPVINHWGSLERR